MSERARLLVLGLGVAGCAVMLVAGLHGLRPFGHYDGVYGTMLLAAAPRQRQIQNIVTAVNFDYRGFDTLGEEFILFTAVLGVTMLLRTMRSAKIVDTLPVPEPGSLAAGSLAIRALGALLAPVILFFGVYVVSGAHLSVGGGFQGGVVLSGAWLTIYVCGGDRFLHNTMRREVFEALEALGAGGFGLIGALALLTGAPFLTNFFPKGSMGNLLSAGAVPLINFSVGLEVCTGFVLLYSEFVEEMAHRVTRPNWAAGGAHQ